MKNENNKIDDRTVVQELCELEDFFPSYSGQKHLSKEDKKTILAKLDMVINRCADQTNFSMPVNDLYFKYKFFLEHKDYIEKMFQEITTKEFEAKNVFIYSQFMYSKERTQQLRQVQLFTVDKDAERYNMSLNKLKNQYGRQLSGDEIHSDEYQLHAFRTYYYDDKTQFFYSLWEYMNRPDKIVLDYSRRLQLRTDSPFSTRDIVLIEKALSAFPNKDSYTVSEYLTMRDKINEEFFKAKQMADKYKAQKKSADAKKTTAITPEQK